MFGMSNHRRGCNCCDSCTITFSGVVPCEGCINSWDYVFGGDINQTFTLPFWGLDAPTQQLIFGLDFTDRDMYPISGVRTNWSNPFGLCGGTLLHNDIYNESRILVFTDLNAENVRSVTVDGHSISSGYNVPLFASGNTPVAMGEVITNSPAGGCSAGYAAQGGQAVVNLSTDCFTCPSQARAFQATLSGFDASACTGCYNNRDLHSLAIDGTYQLAVTGSRRVNWSGEISYHCIFDYDGTGGNYGSATRYNGNGCTGGVDVSADIDILALRVAIFIDDQGDTRWYTRVASPVVMPDSLSPYGDGGVYLRHKEYPSVTEPPVDSLGQWWIPAGNLPDATSVGNAKLVGQSVTMNPSATCAGTKPGNAGTILIEEIT